MREVRGGQGVRRTFFLAKSPEAPNTTRLRIRWEIRRGDRGGAPTTMVFSLSASPLISMEGIVPERARCGGVDMV